MGFRMRIGRKGRLRFRGGWIKGEERKGGIRSQYVIYSSRFVYKEEQNMSSSSCRMACIL